MKKWIISLLMTALLFSMFGCTTTQNNMDSSDSQAITGTFEGTGAGKMGDIVLDVVMEEGKIAQINITSHTETEGIYEPAFENTPQEIITNQSINVDTVSGATYTSLGIIEAVKNALIAAGANLADYEKTVDKSESAYDWETIDYDLIVVGGGLSGMSSALRASELGAKVLVLEQSDHLGGNLAYIGGWYSAAGSSAQKNAGIEDSAENYYQDIIRLNGKEMPNPKLAMAFCEKSGEATDWLEQYVGVDFENEVSFGAPIYPKQNVMRVLGGKGGNQLLQPLTAKMNEQIEKGTIQVLFNCQAIHLVQDSNGVVTGVQAKAGNEEHTFNSEVTIMATGGYGYSEEWLTDYNFDHVTSLTPSTANGTGYTIMEEVGATFGMMDFCSTYPGSVPVSGFDTTVVVNTHYSGAIWIDNTGNRFYNEWDLGTNEVYQAWSEAKNNEVFVVVGENMIQNDSVLINTSASAVDPSMGWDSNTSWTMFNQYLEEENCIFKAETVEELAELMNVDESSLKATIEEYNKSAESGTDPEYGRSEVVKLEAPYYAVYTVPFVVITNGGVNTNELLQPITENGNPIEGVYCVGELTGLSNITGTVSVAGSGASSSVSFGLLAAEKAVEELGISK